jgi:hypothetical protein
MKMKGIFRWIMYGITTALALYLGCLGVHIIEEYPLGWALLVAGVSYPAGIILYEIRQRAR